MNILGFKKDSSQNGKEIARLVAKEEMKNAKILYANEIDEVPLKLPADTIVICLKPPSIFMGTGSGRAEMESNIKVDSDLEYAGKEDIQALFDKE